MLSAEAAGEERHYSDSAVSGVKMPFHWTVIWLDGRDSFEITGVQENAIVDAAKFGKPAPGARQWEIGGL